MTWLEVRRFVPNALTLLRYAAVPVFAWLLLAAGEEPAWGAGLFFAGAALTDQLDGYLARRWQVQSRFGTIADPLADRLLIAVAVVLLWLEGRIPLAALVVVLSRDLLLVLGYKLVVPRGYPFEVAFLGKLATWVLYASLGLVLVTEEGTGWPLALLWVGVALAVAAGVQYLLRAWSVLRRPARGRDAGSARERV